MRLNDWLSEGAARRSDARIAPIMHLLVRDSSGGGWLLWCSAGKATEFEPAVKPRRCPSCQALAREAVDDETLSAADGAQWLKGTPDGA